MPGRRQQTYAALLRGVNLGSRNRVSMPALRELLVALGFDDVQTYLQSGNAVFRSDGSAAAIRERVEDALADELGVEVAVVLRTAADLRRVVSANPFAKREQDPKKLLVTFLAEAPKAAAVRGLDPAAFAPDEFRVVRREVYLHCPNGYGRTKLGNAFFESKLGVIGTNRNWRTVTALADLAGA